MDHAIETLPAFLAPSVTLVTDDTPSFLYPQNPQNPQSRDTGIEPIDRTSHNRERRDIREMQFEAMFERVLENLIEGIPVAVTLREDPRQLPYGPFLTWVHKDEGRKIRYEQAQELGCEYMAAQIVEIAAAENNSLEDVQRSKLRVDTIKFLMRSFNREKYGETKQIDTTVHIDLGSAIEAARERALGRKGLMIEGEVSHD